MVHSRWIFTVWTLDTASLAIMKFWTLVPDSRMLCSRLLRVGPCGSRIYGFRIFPPFSVHAIMVYKVQFGIYGQKVGLR